MLQNSVQSEIQNPQSGSSRPDPGAFVDYRVYLKQMLDYIRATRGSSLRKLSIAAGFKSHSFLQQVIVGKRNLSYDSLQRCVQALELTQSEGAAFESLVLYCQAENDGDRTKYFQRLEAARTKEAIQMLEEAQYDVFRIWYAIPIREMVTSPSFQEDAVWIARAMQPRITAGEAQHALDLLLQVGLLGRDSDGKLILKDAKLGTPRNGRSVAMRRYHRQLMEFAIDSLDQLPPTQRHVAGVTFRLTESQYELVTQLIEQFRFDLCDIIEDAPQPADAQKVYQIVMELFPLTHSLR